MNINLANKILGKTRAEKMAVAGAGLLVASTSAMADVDTTAIIATIVAAGVACAAVGTAMLSVRVGIKTFKLIRSSL